MMTSFLTHISSTKQIVEARQEQLKVGASVMARFTRELQLITVKGLPLIPYNGGALTQKGRDLFVMCRRVSFGNGTNGGIISFMSNDAGQAMPGQNSSTSGSVQITYRLMQNPESDRRGLTLVREELPALRPEADAIAARITFPLADGVRSIRFRFYNENTGSWSEEWGNNRNERVPALVEFYINFEVGAFQGGLLGGNQALPLPGRNRELGFHSMIAVNQ